MRPLLLPGALALALAGCTGPAETGDAAADGLSRARRVYVNKCSRCHRLYDPRQYSEEEWREWMRKMSRKAKLKPEQEELVANYVETLRGGRDRRDGRD